MTPQSFYIHFFSYHDNSFTNLELWNL